MTAGDSCSRPFGEHALYVGPPRARGPLRRRGPSRRPRLELQPRFAEGARAAGADEHQVRAVCSRDELVRHLATEGPTTRGGQRTQRTLETCITIHREVLPRGLGKGPRGAAPYLRQVIAAGPCRPQSGDPQARAGLRLSLVPPFVVSRASQRPHGLGRSSGSHPRGASSGGARRRRRCVGPRRAFARGIGRSGARLPPRFHPRAVASPASMSTGDEAFGLQWRRRFRRPPMSSINLARKQRHARRRRGARVPYVDHD